MSKQCCLSVVLAVVLAAAMTLIVVPAGLAQIVVPSRPHDTLEIDLHSMRDKVTLYKGDSQELLRMQVYPDHVHPRVEYTNQGRAILRIHDQYVNKRPADFDTLTKKQKQKYLSDIQTWDVRVSPAGPTKFLLQCEQGEGTYDFTDFEVKEVNLQAHHARVRIEIARPNIIEAELLWLSVLNGTLEIRDILYARAKEILLVTTGSWCDISITGKPFEGQMNMNFTGGAEEINLLISPEIGLRVGGPAEVLAHFKSKGLLQESKDHLVSKDYEKAKCQVHLTFSEGIKMMKVAWD